MKKLIKKIVQVERTPLHGQESIFYWEDTEEVKETPTQEEEKNEN